MDSQFSNGLDQVFKHSKNEARRLHSEFLNTEHFLLGMIKTDNSAKEIMHNLGADLTQIKRKIETMSVASLNPFSVESEKISFTKMADQAIKIKVQKSTPCIYCSASFINQKILQPVF